MNAEDQLLFRIVEAAREVHSALGPGFVEKVYGRALTIELKNNGFRVHREKAVRVWYGASLVGRHRLDLVVDELVILELKASRSIIPVNIAQVKFIPICLELQSWSAFEFWGNGVAMGIGAVCFSEVGQAGLTSDSEK